MLKVESLHYKSILKGVSLTVKKGETIGLVGQSGSGKTMTAQALMGFIHPDAGAIFWEGQNLCGLPFSAWQKIRGAAIGMVFQNPATALNPTMRISRQVGEALGSYDRGAIGSLLAQVGIPAERMDDYPFQFSGGMRQRIVIAMAIAKKPSLLIADEPTTALDALTQNEILHLLKSLVSEHQMSLLLITHDLAVVRQMCQSVFFMHQGSVVESGPVDHVLAFPKHPYVQELVKARQRLIGVSP